MTETIHTLLNEIQTKLKAPKSKYNSFGEYHYRSLEDILEGVKPLLPAGAAVCLSDELINLGDRYYVKATASLCHEGQIISTTGWAREDLERKKMHPEQLTGCSSSYARKYALNGLFCIDDTKDADAEQPPEKKPEKANGDLNEDNQFKREDKVFQRDFLYSLANVKTEEEITNLVEEFGDRFDALPEYMNGQITDAIEMKRKQIKNGVSVVPTKFGFLDVAEALEFGAMAKEIIDTENNLDDLREWMVTNDHKLKALDTMLKAAKYNKDGTPYERLKNAYNKRLPQAAE